MVGDWIRLHRKVIDSQVFSDHKLLAVWIWCLCRANYKARFVNGQKIAPGQFITGRFSGAEELRMSPSAFYRAMQKLEEWNMIKLDANNKWTTVSICNWTTYQSRDSDERTTDEQQMDNKRTTDEQQTDTDKKVKKDKKGEKGHARPTLEQVEAYCQQRGNKVDARKWFDHYSANGWKVGKNPMRDWQAAVRTWERNDYAGAGSSNSSSSDNYNPLGINQRIIG